MSRKIWLLIGALASAAPACVAQSTSQPASGPAVVYTGGFADHRQPVQGGWIDWTNGQLLVTGTGRAKGTSPQQRLMAQRAAEVVALRNATALAAGIRIDADGRVDSVRDGSLYVQGLVQGQQVVKGEWAPNAEPPRYTTVVRVPLWGVKGVASLFWRTQQVQLRHSTTRTATKTVDQPAGDTVVVFDARGRALSPCVFPAVLDPKGRVVFDIASLPVAIAREMPPARYVETKVAFEQLSSVPAGELKDGEPGDTITRVARKRLVVRVTGTAGPQKTQLVITQEDADQLAGSTEALAAMQHAHVLIVVEPPSQTP